MDDLKKLTVAQLKEQLTAHGLDTSGLKAALLARLEAAVAAAGSAAPAAEAAPAAPPPAAPPPAAPLPAPAPPPPPSPLKRKEPESDAVPPAAAQSAATPSEPEAAPLKKKSRWDSAEGGAPAPPAPAVAAAAGAGGVGAAGAVGGSDAGAKAREMMHKKNELAEKLAKLRQLKGVAAGAAPPPASAALPPSLAGVLAPDAVARVQAIASRLTTGGAAAAAPGLLRPPGATGFSAVPAPPPPPRSRPVALRLDAAGREVDESGKLIVREVKAVATLRVNARAQRAEELRAAMDEARREVAAETAAGGVDEAAKRRARETRSLQFLDPGLVTKRAEESRMQAALRAQFGDAADAEARRIAARAKRREDEAARIAGYEAAGAAEAAAGAVHEAGVEDVPEVEWWDGPLLGGASYEEVLRGTVCFARDKISVYVEHPVPLQPPGEAPPPPPQPLKLTAKEQKKLRTQRRLAREKERQEMLRQGLLEPPKPKVRIANLMRVLGEQAVADPTAIEKEVRAQMAERAAAHEDRNAARALTPAERREKQARKLFEDAHGGGELQCAVYRVESLAHPLNSYKVILNAEENQLTGCGLKTDAFALVVVEGARKAIARYNKLMLRRMNWKLRPEPRADEGEGEDEDTGIAAEEDSGAKAAKEEAEEALFAANKCTLVWQGAVLKPAFKRFKFEPIRSAAGAAKYLEDMGLRNFWDLAAAGVSVE